MSGSMHVLVYRRVGPLLTSASPPGTYSPVIVLFITSFIVIQLASMKEKTINIIVRQEITRSDVLV